MYSKVIQYIKVYSIHFSDVCVLYTYTFQILFHYRLLQSIEYNSLCYTIRSCYLCILFILVSEWTPGVGDGQGGLECCNSWGRKESDTTEQLIWYLLVPNSVLQLLFFFLLNWFLYALILVVTNESPKKKKVQKIFLNW